MERAEIERFERELGSLKPTKENLRRIAEAYGNYDVESPSYDPRVLDDKTREMTARFLLSETDSPEEPGEDERLRIFLEAGNIDVPFKLACEMARRRNGRPMKNSIPEKYGLELSEAIRNNDFREVGRLLATGADPNASRWELLMSAAISSPWFITVLLVAGAKPNRTGVEGGQTELMRLIYNNEYCLSDVNMLLAAGADPNMRHEFGETAMTIAAEKKRVDVFVRLAEVAHESLVIEAFEKMKGAVKTAVAMKILTRGRCSDKDEILSAAKTVFYEKTAVATRFFLEDCYCGDCSLKDFSRFLDIISAGRTRQMSLNAEETRTFSDKALELLENDPDSLETVLTAMKKRFVKTMEKHVNDPLAGPSVNLLMSTMATLLESNREHGFDMSF